MRQQPFLEGLLGRCLPFLLFGKRFGNASEHASENALENASENASENAVWGAAGAPQRGEASIEKARHVEKTLRNAGGFRIIWSAGSRYGIELTFTIMFIFQKKSISY